MSYVKSPDHSSSKCQAKQIDVEHTESATALDGLCDRPAFVKLSTRQTHRKRKLKAGTIGWNDRRVLDAQLLGGLWRW
jgi:hypothetical protein